MKKKTKKITDWDFEPSIDTRPIQLYEEQIELLRQIEVDNFWKAVNEVVIAEEKGEKAEKESFIGGFMFGVLFALIIAAIIIYFL